MTVNEGGGMSDYVEVTEQYGELRVYSSGEWVTYAQSLLAGHGFGPADAEGYFTPHTEQLVLAFQESVGLTRDGIVGKTTWAELEAAAVATTLVLEFATDPAIDGIGMGWTVRNAGGSAVAPYTVLGDYEVWDRDDLTRTVAQRQTFSNLNKIPVSGTEQFFIDLESITPADGHYKAVVQLGTEVRELDYDLRGAKVAVP
jgi:peptidoglycan hydrolase-like protein with peptidoglycan-binding domain